LTDNIGSVRLFVTTAGTILDQLSYDGYGNILTETSSANGDRFKYTARDWDSEIGLQYNRARYYDPKGGRWISLDPTAFGAGDANLYRYVGDDPTGRSDAQGLAANTSAEEPWKFVGTVTDWPMAPFGDGVSKVEVKTGFSKLGLNFIAIGFRSPTVRATTHFVQFIRRTGVIPQGKLENLNLVYTQPIANVFRVYKYGSYYFDGTAWDRSYDGDNATFGGQTYRVNGVALAIADSAPVIPLTKDLISAKIEGDDYLVDGTVTYYHIHWERTTTRDPKTGAFITQYGGIYGERCGPEPPFLLWSPWNIGWSMGSNRILVDSGEWVSSPWGWLKPRRSIYD
jgi:RHS repeat-associated protein